MCLYKREPCGDGRWELGRGAGLLTYLAQVGGQAGGQVGGGEGGCRVSDRGIRRERIAPERRGCLFLRMACCVSWVVS